MRRRAPEPSESDDTASLAGMLTYAPYPVRFGKSLQVENGTIAVGGSRLEAFVFEPCGNGKAAAAEQCDDGNEVSGDGCSDTCRLELCPPEWAAGH